jgi:lysophospholipid acyltransferase
MLSSIISTITDIVPINILITVTSFVLMIPFGWIMNNLIKGRSSRLVYSTILGLCFQYMVYGYSMYHVFIAALVNLLIVRNFKKNIGKYATIYNFTHNGLIHLYRLLFDYENWSVEISTIFMMTICKLCAFAYSFEDGVDHKENVKNGNTEIQISAERRKYMITDFNNFEYFCYVYFYPTAICGPFIEFRDFQNFINREEEYTKIPSTVLPSLKRLSHAIIFCILYFAFKPYGDVDKIIDAEGKYSFLEKCFYFICGCAHQYKYIGGFCFAEATIIACGFAYNGEGNLNDTKDEDNKAEDSKKKKHNHEEEHDTWGKVRCISFFKLSMVNNPTNFFHYWNISIHTYLKRYIYSRLLPANPDFAQRQLASSRTFFVSALWHGFHPTYFLVFTHFFFYTLIDRQVKGILSILKMDSVPGEGFFIFIIRLIILLFLVPYHVLMFVCLDHTKLYLFLKSIHFSGFYLALLSNIILYIVMVILKKNRKKELKKN